MPVTPAASRDTGIDLDLPDIEKHNWKSADIRDRWIPHIRPGESPLMETFETAVQRDDHPRQGYLTVVGPAEGLEVGLTYANKGLSVSTVEVELDGDSRIAVAQSDEAADELATAVEENDFPTMARLFGQPACCRQHTQHWREEGIIDPVYEVACNTPSAEAVDGDETKVRVADPHAALNPFFSYLGWQFTSFYPCSFECDAALDIARQNAELMYEVDVRSDQTIDALHLFLQHNAVWEAYHGLANVRNAHCTGEYRADNRWDKRTVIWNAEHDAKASC